MEFLASLILCLCITTPFLYFQATAETATIPGTIERITKQQILSSVPPNQQQSVPFLTSPSGKYAALLVRNPSVPEAGGFGNDFCIIQVVDTGTKQSMWESECGPVSTVNTCAVVFTDNGLEVFDGSTSVWDTGAESADDSFLESLELVDQGDMRIRDKDGELAWKASDDPRADQHCGMPGSEGLAPALPPFAQPIGQDSDLPFGQPQQNEPQQQIPQASTLPLPNSESGQQNSVHQLNGASQSTFGFGSQPLVDNSPYDSGCTRETGRWIGVGVTVVFGLLFVAF